MGTRTRSKYGFAMAIVTAMSVTGASVRADEDPSDGTGCQNYNNTLCGSRTSSQCARWERVFYPALNLWVDWCAEREDVQIPVNGPVYSNGP